ncbi:type II toxin-antitoxin system YoeB family toxin [Desulfoscipio sp. XC116]
MQKAWTGEAWENYIYWQTQGGKILKLIDEILKDISRDPFSGIGKPEQ